MRSVRPRRVGAVAIALSLLAGACSDGDDAPVESTAHESATTSTTEAAAAPDTDATPAETPDESESGDDDGATDAGSDDGAAETTTTESPTTTAPPASTTTTTLPAQSGLPPEDERGENEAGIRIDLDQTATLACANAEFAREALRTDLLDDALVFTSDAADRAEPSAVTELAALASELRAARSAEEIATVIDQTLEICVELGHQI